MRGGRQGGREREEAEKKDIENWGRGKRKKKKKQQTFY